MKIKHKLERVHWWFVGVVVVVVMVVMVVIALHLEFWVIIFTRRATKEDF